MTLVSPGKPARTVSAAVSCETENQQETLYTCPANCRAEVTMLYVVNVSGNTTVSATWYRAAETTSYNLLGGKNLTAGQTILLTGSTLVLEPGDQLRATPSSNASPNVDVFCTVTETFTPVG